MDDKPRLIRGCWGSTISACSKEKSKEHVFSKGIFEGISTQTLTLSNEKPIASLEVGVNSLVLPILCRKHNNSLSRLDAEAKRWHTGVSQLVSRPIGETGLEDETGQAVLTIDGPLFERWGAKTFLNAVLQDFALFPEKRLPLSINSASITKPVFLGAPFDGRQGLYGLPLGTNLFDDPKLKQTFRYTIISQDVRLRKGKTSRWSGPYRLPMFLYMNAHGFELLLHANLTQLNDGDWAKCVHAYWQHEKLRLAVPRPRKLRFDIVHLDGPRGPRPNRVIQFIWPE